MKKLLQLSALLLLVIFTSCETTSEHEKLLGGEHILRKFNIRTTTTTSNSGYWFLVVGGYSSQTITESKVRFYFKSNNGNYIFKELDFEDVQINVDESPDIPYVKFYWRGDSYGNHVYDDITGAVIYCKESDFQPELNINELN